MNRKEKISAIYEKLQYDKNVAMMFWDVINFCEKYVQSCLVTVTFPNGNVKRISGDGLHFLFLNEYKEIFFSWKNKISTIQYQPDECVEFIYNLICK